MYFKKLVIGVFAAVLCGPVLASGEAKVGGKFESNVKLKNVTQLGIGKKVKQRLSAGSVECATVEGDFKSTVEAKNVTQLGIGKSVNQSLALGSVVGSGCSN